MPLITEKWRAYICTVCKLQCDVTGVAAVTGRVLYCPDCVTRSEMVPQGNAWTAIQSEVGLIGSRGTMVDVVTALANAVIDIRNLMERRFDPRDPDVF
jgi:hypothetical protein